MSSWRALLLRIGEKCAEYGGNVDFKEHIDTCFGLLWRELDHSSDDILSFLLECAEQIPHKIPLYGVMVGLLNLESESFVKTLVDSVHTSLQEALDSGNCNRIRVLLRFITALVCSKVLQPGSLIEIFDTLLSSAATIVDEERGNPCWQPQGDFYVSCILSCLPWGGAEMLEVATLIAMGNLATAQVPEEFERVMTGVEAYMSIRKSFYGGNSSVLGFSGESYKKDSPQDFLEDLWGRIQALSSNGWIVESVPRPHLSFEAQLVAAKTHNFCSITCPDQFDPPSSSSITCGKQKYQAESKYAQRLNRLYLFPPSKSEQDMQPIDRFVIEEYLLDVLFYFNGCRKECASYLASLPVPFRYEYLMAETIFSQLLLLPQPPFKPIYYTLAIIDLCKALPGAFPAVVAGSVRSLFDKIAEMDTECRIRLILWFSHHISNFQFIWPWEEWSFVLDLPKWAPQRVFVQEVLEREVRLSYWDKIKQSIENATALEDLLPPKGGFNRNSAEGKEDTEQSISLELTGMVKGKKTVREIIIWVEENVIPVHGQKIGLEVVVQTFLAIGSKSFTHLITVLERYGQVISKMCSDQDKQVQLIEEVSLCWKNNAQMAAITIDRMMGYRLVSNMAIVRWCFMPSNVEQFHLSDRVWEILRNAVGKTYNRLCDLRKEILSLNTSIFAAEKSVTEAKEDLEAAESKLELINGEPVQGGHPGRIKRLKSYYDKAKEEELSLRESLEAKSALLNRATEENEALFICLYKSCVNVLMERLPRVSPDGGSRPHNAEAVGEEAPSAMDVDNENQKSDISQANGQASQNIYTIGEEEELCRVTLGYLKAFSRQYAAEIWQHIEKLDAEVFSLDLHPLIIEAFYSGIRRPIE